MMCDGSCNQQPKGAPRLAIGKAPVREIGERMLLVPSVPVDTADARARDEALLGCIESCTEETRLFNHTTGLFGWGPYNLYRWFHKPMTKEQWELWTADLKEELDKLAKTPKCPTTGCDCKNIRTTYDFSNEAIDPNVKAGPTGRASWQHAYKATAIRTDKGSCHASPSNRRQGLGPWPGDW